MIARTETRPSYHEMYNNLACISLANGPASKKIDGHLDKLEKHICSLFCSSPLVTTQLSLQLPRVTATSDVNLTTHSPQSHQSPGDIPVAVSQLIILQGDEEPRLYFKNLKQDIHRIREAIKERNWSFLSIMVDKTQDEIRDFLALEKQRKEAKPKNPVAATPTISSVPLQSQQGRRPPTAGKAQTSATAPTSGINAIAAMTTIGVTAGCIALALWVLPITLAPALFWGSFAIGPFTGLGVRYWLRRFGSRP